MGPDGSDESVDPKPPRLDIANGDSARAPLGGHELRRGYPGASRSEAETPINPRARNTRDQDALETPW
jgi:hypothetical protein